MNSVDTSSHVWLDLVDSQHPDFTTVAQLNTTAGAVEGEGVLVLSIFVCVYCVLFSVLFLCFGWMLTLSR